METGHFLKCITQFNYQVINEAGSFIRQKTITDISLTYEKSKQNVFIDSHFNLFSLISDFYYRETFHSDILYAFLTYKDGVQKNLFVDLFIIYLNTLGAKINPLDFNNVIVEKEKGKVDLLISDIETKKCIIIENKINNARDTYRQLPNYLEYVHTNRGMSCACIVYLSLNKIKLPDTLSWTPAERLEIPNKFIGVIAYNNTANDLTHGWIDKLQLHTNDLDALLVSKQYGSLLKKLGGNIMNNQIMEGFFTQMLVPETYQTALSVKSMVSDLILFRANRIQSHCNENLSPFGRVVIWQNYVVAMTDCFENNIHWSIDVGIYDNEYRFEFWDRSSEDIDVPMAFLKKMNLLDDSFYPSGGRMKRKFKFPEEEQDLYVYIDAFKVKLREALNIKRDYTTGVLN
jgi:hypothetical protein